MEKAPIRVVLVDDDHAVRESLRFSLQLDGLAVRTCDSGLTLLRDDDFMGADCLVLDYKMPDMDGFAVMAALATRNVTVPVILITAPVTERIRQQAKRAGAFSVLEKPLLNGILADHVRRAALAYVLEGERASIDLAPEMMRATSGSAGAAGGLRSFNEKREPVFTGH